MCIDEQHYIQILLYVEYINLILNWKKCINMNQMVKYRYRDPYIQGKIIKIYKNDKISIFLWFDKKIIIQLIKIYKNDKILIFYDSTKNNYTINKNDIIHKIYDKNYTN